MTSDLALIIENGWNVGFYMRSENTDDGIRNVIRWRAKNVEGEEKVSARAFYSAQDAIDDFCALDAGKIEL